MVETATALKAWESFYVIVGSSAAALTGLFFVVVALIADLDAPGTPRAIAAFSTPNIVHFCAALLILVSVWISTSTIMPTTSPVMQERSSRSRDIR